MALHEKYKVFIVLGFSRSGTSVVSHLLKESGIYWGEDVDLRPPGPRNPKGYFENRRILEIDRRLIREAGFLSGRDVFSRLETRGYRTEGLHPKSNFWRLRRKVTCKKIEKFVAQMNTHDVWGFKGNMVTFRLWKRYIKNPALVVVFRHPLAVACSHMISSREKEVFTRTLYDWRNLYSELLYDIAAQKSLVVSYEDLINDSSASLSRLIKFLGSGDREQLHKVLDQSLDHNDIYKKMQNFYPLDDQTEKVFFALQKLARMKNL